jgi:hypothetical protein
MSRSFIKIKKYSRNASLDVKYKFISKNNGITVKGIIEYSVHITFTGADGVSGSTSCYTTQGHETIYRLGLMNSSRNPFKKRKIQWVQLKKDYGEQLFNGIENTYKVMNCMLHEIAGKEWYSKDLKGYANALYEAGRKSMDLIYECHYLKRKNENAYANRSQNDNKNR